MGDGSCNETANVPDADYCSWEGAGTEPTIGAGSCTEKNSCTELGHGVTVGDDSCKASFACNALGFDAEVGANSCNGLQACWNAGNNFGSFSAVADSCNGETACSFAGYSFGSFSAGAGSCNEPGACSFAGDSFGSFSAGEGSCNGVLACHDAGRSSGSFSAGAGSCTGISACQGAGLAGSFSILSYSCNTEDLISQCKATNATIGDCEYNDAPGPEECATVVVRKYLFPFWDGGRFDLLIDGSPEASNVGHNGTTEPVVVVPGPVTVSEQGAGGTSLGNYRTTVVCHSETGGFVGYGFSTSLTVTVPASGHVTCTFVNQRIWSWFWWR